MPKPRLRWLIELQDDVSGERRTLALDEASIARSFGAAVEARASSSLLSLELAAFGKKRQRRMALSCVATQDLRELPPQSARADWPQLAAAKSLLTELRVSGPQLELRCEYSAETCFADVAQEQQTQIAEKKKHFKTNSRFICAIRNAHPTSNKLQSTTTKALPKLKIVARRNQESKLEFAFDESRQTLALNDSSLQSAAESATRALFSCRASKGWPRFGLRWLVELCAATDDVVSDAPHSAFLVLANQTALSNLTTHDSGASGESELDAESSLELSFGYLRALANERRRRVCGLTCVASFEDEAGAEVQRDDANGEQRLIADFLSGDRGESSSRKLEPRARDLRLAFARLDVSFLRKLAPSASMRISRHAKLTD